MFPVLFTIFGIQVTSFGVFVALGMMTAAWIAGRELTRRGLDSEHAWDLAAYAAVAGILGAKVYYLLLNLPLTLADPAGMIFSRSGLVWYGGFIAGALAVIWRIRQLKLPVLTLGDCIGPGMALGYGIGRIGCFGVGDDYGVPTDAPWAVAFPQGAPPSTAANLRAFGADVPASIPDAQVLAVHPTQLYETGMSIVVFALLMYFRPKFVTPGAIMFLWFALSGVERFIVEIFRAKDDRFLGVFSVAQLISVGLIAIGIYGFLRVRRGGIPAGSARPAAR